MTQPTGESTRNAPSLATIERPQHPLVLVFTDIEGSTELLKRLGDQYAEAQALHHRVLREAVARYNGREVDSQGDSFFFIFDGAPSALAAMSEAQLSLAQSRWPRDERLNVRIGMHAGCPQQTSEGYAGLDVHRAARISAAGHGGQILVSESVVQLLGDVPDQQFRDLGFHRLRSLARPERIYQLLLPDLQTDFPPLRSNRAEVTNLPARLTSFVGRRRELLALKRLVLKTRMVTVTGAGGIGKTSLALSFADQVVENYADGVWLVELASISNGSHIPSAVASVLAVKEEAGKAVQTRLVEALRSRHLLLILDNCEQLVDACAAFARDLLSACPSLTILITSREPLRIPGEAVLRVPSLSIADSEQAVDRRRLSKSEAAQLFVDRAKATSNRFSLTDDNAASVLGVCRALDGIPLAIELAAARLNTLSLELLEQKLSDSLQILTQGARTAPARQQTLRAAIDWSYRLLTPTEQKLLSNLSVFAAGADLESAEDVCGPSLGSAPLLDVLSQLVEKSLVTANSDLPGVRRFRLLEPIRQYAAGRLNEEGQEDATHARHRDYYLRLTERAIPALVGPEQADWNERLEREYDNCRAALNWALEQNPATEALRLATNLGIFWERRGYLSEGRDWLVRTLAAAGEAPPELRAHGLEFQGRLARLQGDYQTAGAMLAKSLEIYREIGDERRVAAVLTYVGITELRQGDYRAARPYQEEALVIYERLADEQGMAAAFLQLGNIARREGNQQQSMACREQALQHYRLAGDRQGIALALNNLANMAYDMCEFRRSIELRDESLALGRELDDWYVISRGQYGLARAIMAESEDNFRAVDLCAEALRICDQHSDGDGVAYCLETLAAAFARSEPEKSARLLGSAAALRGRIGAPLSADGDRQMLALASGRVQCVLDPEEFRREILLGQTLNLTDVISDALETPRSSVSERIHEKTV